MANSLPARLTDDLPATFWGKILSATPVVMTVIATALAGLSSSEMNRAQYERGWGAQLQAKASDQWSFFQAKRLRGVLQGDVADLLAAPHGSPDAAPAERFTFTTRSSLPEMSAAMQQAVQATAAGKPEETLDAMVAGLSDADLESARRLALQRQHDFDGEIERVNSTARGVNGRLRLAAARYEAEARFDQDVANIYELLVRKANLSARRHHARSQRFFMGMLVAQVAVVISTFALAARRRNVLWTIGAVAGMAALLFAVYIYLWT